MIYVSKRTNLDSRAVAGRMMAEMKHQKISMKRLISKSGIDEENFSAFLQGGTLNADDLTAIADVLNLSVDWLFGLTDNRAITKSGDLVSISSRLHTLSVMHVDDFYTISKKCGINNFRLYDWLLGDSTPDM